MNMESPVRICLGAVLIVNLLLLLTSAGGDALPHDPTEPTTKDERGARVAKSNQTTWTLRSRSRNLNVALNELNPKESQSDESEDKNTKYKDRGRIRFNARSKTSTESSRLRVTPTEGPKIKTTTETANILIVTPTPEVKRPTQIMHSMRNYKTKLPTIVSSSSAPSVVQTKPRKPVIIKTETQSQEEYEEDDDEEEIETDNFEKYTSGNFDSSFFTLPSFSDNFGEHSEKNIHNDSFGKYTSFIPSYKPFSSRDNDDDNTFKEESFFDFNSDLTTPKNDFFDKKFKEISQSIVKKLDSITTKTPATDTTHKLVKENVGVETLRNGSPNNKSTVIIKNTKEIRLLDNDEAGTANKELTDVHGTSIYYEMSVLSTETYNINDLNDDDCDNDTLLAEPTVGTSAEQELESIKSTQSNIIQGYVKPDAVEIKPEGLHSDVSPITTVIAPVLSSANPTTQNYSSSTGTIKHVTHNYSSRNRSFSKRLHLPGMKESPNSFTYSINKTETFSPIYSTRPSTRKFHHTTPKNKPVWMTPRRNITRYSVYKTTVPTTIYSEHFNIKDRYTTTSRPKSPNKTTLTTVSSDIDPVLQGDVSGAKKVVHSQSISDNSIPSLWKRGSTKFSSSTEPSVESGASDLEITPTLIAWLASLRSPPSLANPSNNATGSSQKSIDENELQKVGEVVDKRETTTTTIPTTPTSAISDFVSQKITEIDQNRLPWRPVASSLPSTEAQSLVIQNEIKSERLPAESNISVKSSDKPNSTSQPMHVIPVETTTVIEDTIDAGQSWVPVTSVANETAQLINDTIPPVDATKSTGFESITKLPSGTTLPKDESLVNNKVENNTQIEDMPNVPTTTDYEITTIRFTYIPTEVVTTEVESVVADTTTPRTWHSVYPTRTRTTTIKDEEITTYRPAYMTTTDADAEVATTMSETIPETEISNGKKEITETQATITTQKVMTEKLTMPTTTTTPKVYSTETTQLPPEETSTVIVEVKTEINTERELPMRPTKPPTSTEVSEVFSDETHESSSEENSGSNEVITQETTKMEATTTTIMDTTKPETTDLPTETMETTNESIEELTTSEKVKDTTIQPTEKTETISEEINEVSMDVSKETSKEEVTTSEEEASVLSTEATTKSVNDLEDLTPYSGEVTTEASTGEMPDESSSGAAVAIAVSTIGVIALILLVGLLLVVRRRGRRGVYAQRCTPVSLDAYNLDSVSIGQRKGHRLRSSKRSYGNPAFDDEVTSHPMQYAALANFAMDVDSIIAEYAEIPSISVKLEEVPPGCEDKNRYSNVLPLPETRVPLKRIGGDSTTEYINANYITGPGNIRNYYIACQAPMSNTVSDFWRMVWEQNSRVLVMLTEYMENGVEKCFEYLPPSEISDSKRIFGDFQIILKKREQSNKYAISTVQLVNLTTRTWREVTHLWYFWPAKGVPDDYDSVIDFLSEMRSYMKISQTAKEYDEEGVEVIYGDQNRSSFNNLSKLRSDEGSTNGVNVYSPSKAEEQMRKSNNGTLGRMKAASEIEGVRPCVVICASGAGRSAAIIAADVCARALAAGVVDVPRVVRELRAQRPHSLSNRHHYIFLYKVLSEYGNKLMGGGVDTI